MAYKKQTWVDLETPLDAEHMNHIEDGIGSLSEEIEEIDKRVPGKVYDAEIGNTNTSGVTILPPYDEVKSCVISAEKNKLYKFVVSGNHNRFFICGCIGSTAVGTESPILYNSNNREWRNSVDTAEYFNDTYDFFVVTIAYDDGYGSFTGSLTYTVSDGEATNKNVAQYDHYVSHSDISNAFNTSSLYTAYDKLVSGFPDYVSKNTLGQDSSGQNIAEYVFSHGNYNAKETQRNRDDVVAKPVVLIMTGIHGDEKTSIVATYQFMKDLCEYNSKLFTLRENLIFKVIPVACPYGFDNNSRLNENAVNINRNFDVNWIATEQGNNYSGESASDQLETQILQAWIDANMEASLCIDYHNSGYVNEVSCLMGSNVADNMSGLKKSYLKGISDFVPYLEDVQGFDPALVMAYTGDFGAQAMSYKYAENKGILSVCLECSWDQNGSGKHSNLSIKTGAECLGNLLLGAYRYSDVLS
jgi:hypothetical protein